MEKTEHLFKLLKWGIGLMIFVAIVSVFSSLYDFLFGYDRILRKLEENSVQLATVIERNRELELRLAQTEKGIREVHKSLLESQIKLTGLIKDTRGSTVKLNENAETVKDDLTGIIRSIDVVLAKGGSDE